MGMLTYVQQLSMIAAMVISGENQLATASATEDQTSFLDAVQLGVPFSTQDSENPDSATDEDDAFGRFVSGMLKKLGEEEKRKAKEHIVTYLQNMQLRTHNRTT
ncbi:uncharacterized protein ACN427_009729 isoform 1-T2 [Glossina fuscipes fuscipes]